MNKGFCYRFEFFYIEIYKNKKDLYVDYITLFKLY